MSPRTTGVLAILAALLGAIVYFYEIGGEADRKSAEEADRRIFPELEADAIDAIALDSQDGIASRFVRANGIWQLAAPVEAPADAASLDAMASVLAQLVGEGRIEETNALEDFGLGEGARTIRFESEGRELGLRIGRATPVGGHVYVTPVGREEVSFVESFRLNAFNRNLADLRDRRVMPFEPADVTGISLSFPSGDVELARREGGWWVTSPVEEPADEPTVRDLLDDLSTLRATRFVDEEDGERLAALAQPAIDVALQVAGAEQQATIGVPAEGSPIVRGPSGRIFEIAPERLEDLERDVPSYRFRTLSEFEVSQAQALTIAFADPVDAAGGGASRQRRVELKREGSSWGAAGHAVDSMAVEAAVRSLSQLRATTVVADEMGENERSSLGLEPARGRVIVEASDGEAEAVGILADVLFGRLDAARGLYAMRAGDPKIYLVDPDVASGLPISGASFDAAFLAEPEPEPEPDEEAEFGPQDRDEEEDDPMPDLEFP
jgi:hypothetical protein